MRHRRTFFSVMAAVAFGSASWVGAMPSASGDPAANVTICHRTNSVTNPYVTITVDESAVDGDSGNDHGQGDHLLEHLGPVFDPSNPPPPPHNGDQWGDIIPPFDVNGDPRPNTSLTLNWPAGQATFANGCTPTSVTGGTPGSPGTPGVPGTEVSPAEVTAAAAATAVRAAPGFTG